MKFLSLRCAILSSFFSRFWMELRLRNVKAGRTKPKLDGSLFELEEYHDE